MSNTVIAGLLTLALLVAIMFGIHVGIALMLISFIGIVLVSGYTAAMGSLMTTPYTAVLSYTFTIIPLYVLMGEFARFGGISQAAYRIGYNWFGRIPGGLAIATIVGSAGFAATTGSSLVSAMVFTKLALPEMLQYGYDRKFACGAIAGGGTLGMLIPPSILFVVFGMLTDVSIGRLLISGIGPGLMLTVLFMVCIYLCVKINPKLAPGRLEAVSWRERFTSIPKATGILLIFGVTMGGIYLGIFTPTEAASVGALATLMVMLVAKGFSWRPFKDSSMEAARVASLVFLIVIGGTMFSRFLAISGLSHQFVNLVLGLHWPPIGLLVAVLIMYLILGCFLDSVSCFVITLPLVFPILVQAGYDPVFLGVIIVLTMEVGLLTPPVGINVFVVKAAAPVDISLEEIFVGIIPFFFTMLVAIVILVIFPQIGTYLPYSMMPIK